MSKKWKAVADAIRSEVRLDRLEQAAEQIGGLSLQQFRDIGIQLQAELRRVNGLAVTDPEAAVKNRRELTGRLLAAANFVENRSDDDETPVLEPSASHPPLGRQDAEKIIGSSRNLRDISWLAMGLKLSRSVCRIRTEKGLGTGFVIAPGIVLTNNHVVNAVSELQSAVAEFNYEVDSDGRLRETIRYRFSPNALFHTNPALDYTVVALSGHTGLPALSEWKPLQADEHAILYPGDAVTIIQHPAGGPKKIAVGTNSVTGIFDHRLQYVTDTQPGSSGSPVFNDQWMVVAVHHAGGDLPINVRGDTRFVNEGILISSIRKDFGWPI